MEKVTRFLIEFSFQWPIITFLIVIIFIFTFKKELKMFIERISEFELSTEKFRLVAKLLHRTLESQAKYQTTSDGEISPGEISPEDVKKALSQVPGLSENDINKNYKNLYSILRFTYQFRYTKELEELILDSDSRKILEELYVDVLGRSKENPLDVTGFVCYAPILHIHGLSSKKVIKRILEQSDEYKARKDRT